MQIILNGKVLDLYSDSKVVITKQINDLADLSKANTSFTNKFKVPKTSNNVQILKYLGVAGNQSRVQYSLNKVTLVEDSIILLEDGYCEITDTDENNYNLNIYGAEKTFFEKLKLYTLQDVFPVTNIIWSAQNLLQYVNKSTQFTFIVSQYNAESIHSGSLQSNSAVFSKTKAMSSTPHFYVKYLFENVFSFLGYQVDYPMQNEPLFKTLLMPCQKGVSHFNVSHGATFNLQNSVPEMPCDTFLKEIMFRYGLIIKVDETNKRVKFMKLNALLAEAPVIDWSNKFSSFKSEKYKLDDGYGQLNNFKYSEDIEGEFATNVSQDNELIGQFSIDNQTLDPEKTIVESTFEKPKQFRYYESNDWARGRIFFHTQNDVNFYLLDLAENTLDGSTTKVKELPFQIMNQKNIHSLNFSFLEPNGTQQSLYNITGKIATKDGISFQDFLDTNYHNVIEMLNNVVVMKCMMNLSVMDIYKFDFFSRIYLKQFGCYFYVNKISNYQKNKLVEVELIKIPVDAESYYYQTEMIGEP